jgi:DNA-binding protein HU-beta
MIKADFVKVVARQAGVGSLKDAKLILDAAFEALKSELAAGNAVTLYGFGSFKVVERNARKGRNPRTGKELVIPACKSIKFTPSSALKDAIK